jgi:hypothetical protein
MFTDTRALLRGLGALGATAAAMATFLPWYVFAVVFAPAGVTHAVAVPVTLWGLTTLAPILIVTGATAALVCLAMVDERWAGVIEALIGLGIAVYALVRCFDIPALGVNTVSQILPGAKAATTLEGGPFLALTGGLMLLAGSVGDLLPGAPERPAPPPAAEERGPRRFEREQAPSAPAGSTRP